MLVSVDGAGASREVIEHLHALDTAPVHGGRGRRVEYSIGWPVDARTTGAIDQLGEGDWGPGLSATGEPEAQVTELTGLLRTSHRGDLLASWPTGMRVIARRVPRTPAEQAELGGDAHYRYGRSPPTPPPGRSSTWTPGTAPRPMCRTGSKS